VINWYKINSLCNPSTVFKVQLYSPISFDILSLFSPKNKIIEVQSVTSSSISYFRHHHFFHCANLDCHQLFVLATTDFFIDTPYASYLSNELTLPSPRCTSPIYVPDTLLPFMSKTHWPHQCCVFNALILCHRCNS